jgi:Ca2+-binding RTX toxin-like protein
MATNYVIFSTDTVQSSAFRTSLATDQDHILVREGVELIVDIPVSAFSTSGSSTAATELTFSNHGTILSGATGVNSFFGLGSFSVYNGATGVIGSYLNHGDGISTRTDFSLIRNQGEIYGRRGITLSYSEGSTVDNSGTITGSGTGENDAAISHYSANGISTAPAHRINNSGTLFGATRSEANGGGQWAIYFHSYGSFDSFARAHVVNTGDIFGNISLGQYDDTIGNAGDIIGDVVLGDGDDRVANSGLIGGEVTLGDGADFYSGIGTGVTSGLVLGGVGDDTIVGGDNADLFRGGDDADLLVGRGGNDTMYGEAGNDTLIAGDGDDFLEGGTGDDVVNGNAGADHIYGDVGNDVLVGQDGSDFLDGGDNDDTMDGGNGDDTLEGGDGNDILRGRAGEDELAGGLGRDYLTGGQGADFFVFRALADTVVGANRDQILDFEQGVDLISVAGLSPGVFEFRGTAAFAPSGNPELRLRETATGSTIVQLDNDGDGIADAEIRVANVIGLTADDFVL